MKADDFTKDFLLSFLPSIFNDNKQICSIKEIADADAEKTRKDYADTPEALREAGGKLYLLRPRTLFTANSLLSLFTKAADARTKAAKEAAEGITEAQRKAKRDAAAR